MVNSSYCKITHGRKKSIPSARQTNGFSCKYKKLIDKVSDSALQLTFKKLSLLGILMGYQRRIQKKGYLAGAQLPIQLQSYTPSPPRGFFVLEQIIWWTRPAQHIFIGILNQILLGLYGRSRWTKFWFSCSIWGLNLTLKLHIIFLIPICFW